MNLGAVLGRLGRIKSNLSDREEVIEVLQEAAMLR